jgi:hypothetical protein
VAGAGCSEEGDARRFGDPSTPIRVVPRDDVPTLSGEVVALGDWFPSDTELVGVGVDSNSGDVYVLDARRGVYALGDGSATLVFDLPASTAVGSDGSGTAVPTELTDLAVRSGPSGPELIVTAENDGFVANPRNQVLTSFFCYLPEADPEDQGAWEQEAIIPISVSQEARLAGIDVFERTEAIAMDPWSQEIYAQPRTHRVDGGEVLGSEIFRFGPLGGDAPIDLQRLASSDFVAGGMLVDDASRLLLGQGPNLFTGRVGEDLTHFARVDAAITGMAFDLRRDRMLVLDGPARAMVVIDYGSVGNLLALR